MSSESSAADSVTICGVNQFVEVKVNVLGDAVRSVSLGEGRTRQPLGLKLIVFATVTVTEDCGWVPSITGTARVPSSGTYTGEGSTGFFLSVSLSRSVKVSSWTTFQLPPLTVCVNTAEPLT